MPALAFPLAASMLLVVFPFFSQGEVNIQQVEFVNGERFNWAVDGVATVEIGTGRDFAFDCGLTNASSECLVQWAKTNGYPISQHYTGISQQVQLRFDESTPESLGEYVCIISDCTSEQLVFIIITEANPAVLPVQQDRLITASVGDSVSIEFKMSSLPRIEPSYINWFHDNNPISTTINFSDERRTLIIDNVQLSDAGHYQVEVCVNSQCEVQHTNLSVNGLITTATLQNITPTVASSSNTPSLTISPSISSSSAAKGISQTPELALSSGSQLSSLLSSATILPLSSTTTISPSAAMLVHPLSVTTTPSILQATPTVTSSCFTTIEEDETSRKANILVTTSIILLATMLVATLITNIILLVCTYSLWSKKRRKSSSSEEICCTESKDVDHMCDGRNHITVKEVHTFPNAFKQELTVQV